MTKENLESYLTVISHAIASVMAGSSHTPGCYLSKPRSSLEAGKKQLRVGQQYGCSVAEVPLCLFFCAPLDIFWWPFDDSNLSNKLVQGNFVLNFPSRRKAHSDGSCLFLKGLKNQVAMTRNEFEEDSECLISMKFGNVANVDIFVASQTYILATGTHILS